MSDDNKHTRSMCGGLKEGTKTDYDMQNSYLKSVISGKFICIIYYELNSPQGSVGNTVTFFSMMCFTYIDGRQTSQAHAPYFD